MSDIYSLCAPVRNGKSLYGTISLMGELEASERMIVTDIPLIFENPPIEYGGDWTVADYCHKFIKKPIVLNKRIAVLSYEMGREFWRYLPVEQFPDIEGMEIVEHKWKHGTSRFIKLPNKPNDMFKEVTDFSFRSRTPFHQNGCFYLIDEIHKKFPPMYYQKVGAQAEWYMSEMGKLNDDFWWLTQHIEKVDKNFRRACTGHLTVRNAGKTFMPLGVTLPDKFKWYFYSQPDIPRGSDKPTASGWFKLDSKRRYHHLYKTMDGTGVEGRLTVEDTMKKGRHWSIYIVVFLFLLAGCFVLPIGAQWVTNHGIMGFFKGVENGASHGVMNSAPSQFKQSAPVVTPTVVAPAASSSAVSGSERANLRNLSDDGAAGLYCSGWVEIGTNIIVSLSDGRNAQSIDGDVQGVGRSYVRVFGLRPIPIISNTQQFFGKHSQN